MLFFLVITFHFKMSNNCLTFKDWFYPSITFLLTHSVLAAGTKKKSIKKIVSDAKVSRLNPVQLLLTRTPACSFQTGFYAWKWWKLTNWGTSSPCGSLAADGWLGAISHRSRVGGGGVTQFSRGTAVGEKLLVLIRRFIKWREAKQRPLCSYSCVREIVQVHCGCWIRIELRQAKPLEALHDD